jgi:hypothetical protein
VSTPVERGEELAREARRIGIREIRDLIDGIRARGDRLSMLVALPAAEHALARLEAAEREDTNHG